MAKKKKMSAKQKQEKLYAAEERKRRAKARQKISNLRKNVLMVIVCIVLVAALSLPTLALTVCRAMS
ncbi:MAG: CASC3 protein CASC3 [Eggerthellaceae bacterium]|nr:CASC3 protein CASC3 [Eggerthellaceae bacterium]